LEAEDIFADAMGNDGRFLCRYRHLVRTTLNGIVRGDQLQREKRASVDDLLDAYAETGSVFLSGALASCMKAGRMDLYRHVSVFGSALARVGQLQDDCEDVGEDARRGRWNAAARILFPRRALPKRTDGSGTPIVDHMAHAGNFRLVFLRMDGDLDAAERAARRAGLTEAVEFVAGYRAHMGTIVHGW
jgi:hypothetical protein